MVWYDIIRVGLVGSVESAKGVQKRRVRPAACRLAFFYSGAAHVRTVRSWSEKPIGAPWFFRGTDCTLWQANIAGQSTL